MAAENGMPENEDVRKKALLRLGVAGVVTAAALAGLWWLDQGTGKDKSAPVHASSPTPIVPALPQETAPPRTEPSTPEAPGTTEAETRAAPPHDEAGPASNTEPPPPPRVDNGVKTAPSQSQPRTAPAHNALVPSAPATPTVAEHPPAPTQVIPAGKGYVVQLGVFSNPDNAREMVEKLSKQGIRAHLEARVQLGPFLDRQEAEKAQAEMRKLGFNALVTTPYPANPAR
jgi:DedD protein